MEPFIINEPLYEPVLMNLKPWEPFSSITAGFSTRLGGVSEGVFHSLNCGLHVNDHKDSVIANRTRLTEAVGFHLEDWVSAEQVHGGKVATVALQDRGRGSKDMSDAIADADALITQEPGVLLAAFFADCVPLLFYDPEHEAVGLAHAGWKGTVHNIAKNTIEAMRRQFNTDPRRLHAAIAPSIGPCCYEVDEPVIQQIRKVTADEASYEYTGQEKFRLDLKQLNRHLMIEAGVLPIHIECSSWCTGCHTELFYSYRKENGQTGRMAAWVGIRRR